MPHMKLALWRQGWMNYTRFWYLILHRHQSWAVAIVKQWL